MPDLELEEGEEYEGVVCQVCRTRDQEGKPGEQTYGWIRVKGFAQDIFYHEESAKEGYKPEAGDKVKFVYSSSNRGPRGVGIEKVERKRK